MTRAEILKEVVKEIEAALNDEEGIVSHQRRLAFSLSSGAVTLIEEYLSKKNVLKPGIKINHRWFKKEKENIKKILEKKITFPITELDELDWLIENVHEIEKDRDLLAYGNNVHEDKLKEKINIFLEIKGRIKNES